MLEPDQYKITCGTYYHPDTPDALIKVLEDCRENKTRIIIDYGDTKTGESWGETHDILGTIGRSSGPVRVPLLLHNARSAGGGAILDHCILSVRASYGKELLYKLKISNMLEPTPSQPAHEGT